VSRNPGGENCKLALHRVKSRIKVISRFYGRGLNRCVLSADSQLQADHALEFGGRIMQIGNVSQVTPSTSDYSSSPSGSKPAGSSLSNVAAQSSSTSTVQKSAAANHSAPVSSAYCTTVAGKSYAGTIEESGDTYLASVPVPPGVSASGATAQAAENNLNIILDTLA